MRTGSFLRAIMKTVKPGDIVLDIGCGTGVLSYFACLAGAKRVYAVEQGPIIELAKAICHHNGFDDRVVFFNDWSTNVDLPEQVDVIITETIGNLGFEEGVLGWVIDAKNRFLAPDGQIIPRSIEIMLVPTSNPDWHDEMSTWSQELYSLDFSPAYSLVINNILWAEWTNPELFLSEPQSLVRFDLMEVDQVGFSEETTFIAQRDGLLDGLGAWFSAELTPGLVVSNAPPNQTPSWNQTFFPVERPLRVSAGDPILVGIRAKDNAEHWEWHITVDGSSNGNFHSKGRNRFMGKTLYGRLRSPMQQHSPDYVPVRTEEAEVDLMILSLMDGIRPLNEIARQAAVSFPAYFPSFSGALEYAAQLAEDYAHGVSPERSRTPFSLIMVKV